MIKLGINIIPVMPIPEILETIKAAEAIGYTYCLLADEGIAPDVYVTLGAAARETKQIFLGAVTNGYTRHPAVTAMAAASLNQLSDGRALLALVAGGSIVLDTINIPREKPLSVVRETIEICRNLWSGETINYDGGRFSLRNARSDFGIQNIPIWVAARGNQMLKMAGEISDGVVLTVRTDIAPAVDLISQAGRNPLRIYMDRIAYTEAMIEDSTRLFPYVLKDTPARQLSGFLSESEIKEIQNAFETGGVEAVAPMITREMILKFKVAGTPQQCRQLISQLIKDHSLDVFLLNITTGGLDKNLKMMEEVYDIVSP